MIKFNNRIHVTSYIRFQSKHNDHNPGEWRWEKLNTTVEWFDWAPGQPNDYHRQQCLAYLRYDYFGVTFFEINLTLLIGLTKDLAK